MNTQIEKILLRCQKPARYTGGEIGAIHKNHTAGMTRFAFCFPDVYEIGMSHLGLKILYGLLNEREDVACERFFAPWPDMEAEMRREGIPLWSLESGDALCDFDIIGFTLQYELSYTNILQMLDLGGVPFYSRERDELSPLVIGGGPCACNPEPIADFFDLFVIGEGEEVTLELIDCFREARAEEKSKRDFLRDAARIQGIYVPSLYEVANRKDGTVLSVAPRHGAPERVKKRIVKDLDTAYYPAMTPVPFIDVVHDRVMLEVMRGCIRGCRFCQAGYLYRPTREKSAEVAASQLRTLCERTGYEEASLSSLSTSDYRPLPELLESTEAWCVDNKVNLTLPSLRIDSFSDEVLQKITAVRQASLTFAPEAGTQRMRDVIGKNITRQNIDDTVNMALRSGQTSFKLYFMIGLPGETDEDIKGIIETAQRVIHLYYNSPQKGRGITVSLSVATFVPKPFTPFQTVAQDTFEEIARKHELLKRHQNSRKIRLSYHEAKTSVLEAVFARGDRRLSAVIDAAYRSGCKFDGWGEYFDFDRWMAAFEACSLDPAFYASRERSWDEINPWDHLDYGVSKGYLEREYRKSLRAENTPDCRQNCTACGVSALFGGVCP